MPSDRDDSANPPALVASPRQQLDTLADAAPRSDLTYRLVEGATLTGRDLRQSLFTGAILRNCRFAVVDFSRCDLDGVRIEGCHFVDCNFTNVDIRSAAIARTSFEGCSFDSAYIADVTFTDVRLFRSHLRSAVVGSCSFTGGELSATDITQSSFTQNRFERTRFHEMTLGNCTFLYSIMRDCAFVATSMNAESVGMVWGLSREVLEELGFLYLGREEPASPSGDRAGELLDEYRRRRWMLGVCLLAITLRRSSHAAAIADYLGAVQAEAARDQPLRRDELTFFVTVLEEFAKDEQLPMMSCLTAIETLAALSSRPMREGEAAHSAALAKMLVNRLYALLARMMDDFDARRLDPERFDRDETVRLTAVFRRQPELSLAGVLTDVAAASGLPCAQPSTTLDARKGSYIELVKTTLFSVAAFQIFLFLVNGCIIRLTELRARVNVLGRRRLPRTYLEQALQPQQSLPAHLAVPFQKLLGFAGGISWLRDPDLKGLAAPNLTEATIEREVEPPPAAGKPD